jgi:hypothetical protein
LGSVVKASIVVSIPIELMAPMGFIGFRSRRSLVLRQPPSLTNRKHIGLLVHTVKH